MHRWIEKCAEPPRGARSKRESIEKEPRVTILLQMSPRFSYIIVVKKNFEEIFFSGICTYNIQTRETSFQNLPSRTMISLREN